MRKAGGFIILACVVLVGMWLYSARRGGAGGGTGGSTAPVARPSIGDQVLDGASPAQDSEIVAGFIAGRHRVAAILGSVDDPAEAETHIAEVAAIVQRMRELKTQFEALPDDRQLALLETYRPSLTEGAMAMGNALIKHAFTPKDWAPLADEIHRMPDLKPPRRR